MDDDSASPKFISARQTDVNLTVDLNKTQIVENGISKTAGYNCETCNITLKDSVTYLDHINSRAHQRNLGLSMRVQNSTVEQVKQRILYHKLQKHTKPISLAEKIQTNIIKSKQEAIQKNTTAKAQKLQAKLQLQKAIDESFPPNNELSQIMGFKGFDSSKK